MERKAEKLRKILDVCSFCVALASTVVIALDIKRDKKITREEAVNLFVNGWLFGKLAR